MIHLPYKWAEGAVLKDHSKKKHQILKNYIAAYLHTRCQVVHQTGFRFAIVDAFSGAGKYKHGEPGSPIIFLKSLQEQSKQINIQRKIDGRAIINFECFFIFNDDCKVAIDELKENISSDIVRCNETDHLAVTVEIMNKKFQCAYPEIQKHLAKKKLTGNVLFNLDQCGHSDVDWRVIKDILEKYKSAEVFLTLSIKAMLAFISKKNTSKLEKTLKPHGIDLGEVQDIEANMNMKEWRAAIEQLIFESYRKLCPFVSPFAINNPDGWLYWLLHFANTPKAKQVYNDLLYENEGAQGHYGRSGLRMLIYNPAYEGHLHLFNEEDRLRSREELYYDIPKAVSEFGDAVEIHDFIKKVSNETPAHSLDLYQSMINNPDLKVQTAKGSERRSPNGIKPTDRLVLKPQKSFSIMLSPKKK